MNFQFKKFEELSLSELHDLFKLRNAVFVVEQNCPYQDVDDKDLESHHLFAYEGNSLIAYCRILPPGLSYQEPSIGRVCVDKAFRGQKIGELLMKQSVNRTLELFNNQDIVISAQSYLLAFYQSLGFTEEGESYLEDDIPHIQMRYRRH